MKKKKNTLKKREPLIFIHPQTRTEPPCGRYITLCHSDCLHFDTLGHSADIFHIVHVFAAAALFNVLSSTVTSFLSQGFTSSLTSCDKLCM